ncbi:MAG: integral membrane sensor signal transduction histidine kinase, partial [uncultured bacterium]
KHLSWKLFVSYVIVIIIGVVVLATATSVSIPSAFNRHMSGMSAMMLSNPTMGSTQSMETKLFTNYKAAVTEALTLATIFALLAAIGASFLISRQVVEPIQRLMKLSRKIAAGEYEERLQISGNVQENQLDEVDQLALSFNQMADKLEKTESVRRQLIGDVTHELRTPLSAIKGYMEGLIDGVISATPDTFNQVYAEADRLQRLVNDLQELSRVEAGAYQLKIEPVVTTTLIETVVNHFNRQFDEKGIILKKSIEPNLPNVAVDKDRIVQVLTNLIGNALQYTPTGGEVMVAVSSIKEEVVFTVTDTGIGISPDHLPMIFNRFYRTDKSRTRASGGSGIGLTIAQALVKSHNGRIWVESAGEGKGSSIHFTIPIFTINSI